MSNLANWININEVNILRATVAIFILEKFLEGLTMLIQWIM
jgi:hypothetical protein